MKTLPEAHILYKQVVQQPLTLGVLDLHIAYAEKAFPLMLIRICSIFIWVWEFVSILSGTLLKYTKKITRQEKIYPKRKFTISSHVREIYFTEM